MYKHRTRDGTFISLKDIESDHLDNIIKYIEKRAEEGMTIAYGGGSSSEDIFYDEEEIDGEAVLRKLNYMEYVKERQRRQNGI